MTARLYLLYDPKTTFKLRLEILQNYALMVPYNYIRNRYGRHYIALPKCVNHMSLYHSHDKHKRTNK